MAGQTKKMCDDAFGFRKTEREAMWHKFYGRNTKSNLRQRSQLHRGTWIEGTMERLQSYAGNLFFHACSIKSFKRSYILVWVRRNRNMLRKELSSSTRWLEFCLLMNNLETYDIYVESMQGILTRRVDIIPIQLQNVPSAQDQKCRNYIVNRIWKKYHQYNNGYVTWHFWEGKDWSMLVPDEKILNLQDSECARAMKFSHVYQR